MIKTLHRYIGGGLLRVLMLALLAFTLAMTVVAVMEPLRRQAMAPGQVLQVFGLLVPVILSLTLPVAALFAASVVYGRFAQDNDFLAARASGISTLSLLKPALAMGVVVTVASMFLSNELGPRLAEHAEDQFPRNVQQIVVQQFKQRQVLRNKNVLVRADDAVVDGDILKLKGVVVAREEGDKGLDLLTASTAYVTFSKTGRDLFVTVALVNPTTVRPGEKRNEEKAGASEFVFPIEQPFRDKTSFYTWERLQRTLADPTQHVQIARFMESTRRQLIQTRVCEEIQQAIQAGRSYDEFRARGLQFRIEAPRADVSGKGVARLHADPASGRKVRLEVIGPNRSDIYQADYGEVQATWSQAQRKSFVTITLGRPGGNTRVVRIVPGSRREQPMKTVEEYTQIPIPDSVRAWGEGISLEDLLDHPEKLTKNATILREIRTEKKQSIAQIQSKILAEMHGRMAYGTSCLLLLALGAALGLVFRGGQLIVAFVITLVPAAMIIIMILMGKQLITNPKVPPLNGVVTIWGGVALLLAATIAVYTRLLRQ